MTEDDTFNKLRRTPFHEFRHLIKGYSLFFQKYSNLKDKTKEACYAALYENHHWTPEDFEIAFDNWLMDD